LHDEFAGDQRDPITVGFEMYEKTTRQISVSVRPVFLEEQSAPARNHFVWAYRVNIHNRGTLTVQLLNRHWRITDKFGRLQEVKGPGVVGEQPTLKPGESFDYTSGCPLETPSGIMAGTYEMTTTDGQRFLVEIPAFSLDSPHDKAALN
jgi:ApaG protein